MVKVAPAVVSSLVHEALGSMTTMKIRGLLVGVAFLGLFGYRPGVSLSKAQVPQAASRRSAEPALRNPEQTTTAASTVYSTNEDPTTILEIAADGSTVKKGEIVCVLDSAALRNLLINQRITTKAAEANFQNAKLTRETAELAKTSYETDLLPREQREIQAEVTVAEAELAWAEAQLKETKQRFGGHNEVEVKKGELAVARAKLANEKAVNRQHILEQYTKGRQIKELVSEVEKSLSDELAKGATWELEHAKERKLERLIASCAIAAPCDGTLVRANPPTGDALIQVGATVRRRQPLFRIFAPAEVKPGPH
jgi:hypothetical protein